MSVGGRQLFANLLTSDWCPFDLADPPNDDRIEHPAGVQLLGQLFYRNQLLVNRQACLVLLDKSLHIAIDGCRIKDGKLALT